MRIGFVTQYFPPEGGSLIAEGIADGLAARGHTVDVVTGFPNYPTGVVHADYPMQRYRCDQRSERVTVHRAPLYPNHDANALRRSANYLSFGASAAWLTRSRVQRPDVWLTYLAQPTAAIPVLTAPARLAAPSCVLIIDLWPDSFTDSGFVGGRLGRMAEQAAGSLCRAIYRRASGIGIPSPGMREVLIGRDADPGRIHDIPNWVPDQHLQPDVLPSAALRESLGLPGGRLFMYAGNLGRVQCLRPLVEAFARCPETNLVMVGDGIAREELVAYVEANRIANVRFIGMQPVERIGEFIAASDVQIVSLNDSALLRVTTPSKAQASLAAGRPVLVHAAGDVAELVARHQAGVAVPPGQVEQVAAAIRELHTLPEHALLAMGRASRRLYTERFTEAKVLDRLEAMLQGSCRQSRRTSGGRPAVMRQRSYSDHHVGAEF